MLKKNPYKGKRKLVKPDVHPYEFHLKQPYIKETPLHDHKYFAEKLGVKNVLIKEEGKRCELKSFKVLGVSFALNEYMKKHEKEITEETTFCGATDGNHGRALSYMCQKFGKKCVIYVPFDTSAGRVEAIKKYGATVIQAKVNYDATMEMCDEAAKKNGWVNISDTAYGEDDQEVPNYIMQGYSALFEESMVQIEKRKLNPPTHVFVQAGVGCLAGSCGYFFHENDEKNNKHKPMIICVEPVSADCYLSSVLNEGKLTHSKGNLDSIMNGLNCGVPSYASFPWVINEYSYMMTLDDDENVKDQMRALYEKEPQIVCGESGAAGLSALDICCTKKEEWKKELGIDENSVILVVLTEGDTDPELFQKIIKKEF